jgi:hypothetical protein
VSNHDFEPLVAQYPVIIAQMPSAFSAHEFILRLAQQNQGLYAEALYAYKDSQVKGAPAPFMIVHGILARRLGDFQQLVRQDGTIKSKDIFGRKDDHCSRWQRV